MYNLIYNDINFSEHIKVLEVKKSILPPRTNYTTDIPYAMGERYRGFKFGAREIEIDIALICSDHQSYNNLIRMLAGALNVSEPKKLYLGEELDKYYYAVPEASDSLDQTLAVGKGTLGFICYDPVAYTDEMKLFEGDNLTGITTINNYGNLEAHPVISVAFTQSAHFLQVTNYDKRTILVGQRPSVDVPSVETNPVILNDDCGSTVGWASSGNVLDSDVPREVMGSVAVNKYGTGITGRDYGSSDNGWHGASVRRNLQSTVQDFEVHIDVAFDSKDTGVSGSGGTESSGGIGGTGGTSTSGTYKITASPSLRIRADRNTKAKILGKIPLNKTVEVSDIAKGWGKVTYNKVTGYISMEHTKVVANTGSTGARYRVNTSAGLNLRSGRGSNYTSIAKIPYNTTVTVTDIQNGWGRVAYNGKTGYCSMQYLTAVSRSLGGAMVIDESEYEDFSKMGRIEVYLFDENSQKIGKFSVKDSQAFYEFVEPEIFIGSNRVLYDSTVCPKAKTETRTEGEEKVTVNIDSGKYGAWNDGTIRFSLSRLGTMWQCKMQKLQNGKVVKTLSSNTLVNSKYPTGKLASVVLWFGQYKSAPVSDTISVENVRVTSYSEQTEEVVNNPIFQNGDELQINCEEHKIYLNGVPFMDKLDIGSEFFTSAPGDSQFLVKSDDRYIHTITGIREKFL